MKRSAKEKDEETGYSYFGARYYDSDLSIWLSVDPMHAANPHLQSYHYCSQNPLNRTDMTGMLDDWIYNPKTKEYVWDENVTNAENRKRIANKSLIFIKPRRKY